MFGPEVGVRGQGLGCGYAEGRPPLDRTEKEWRPEAEATGKLKNKNTNREGQTQKSLLGKIHLRAPVNQTLVSTAELRWVGF